MEEISLQQIPASPTSHAGGYKLCVNGVSQLPKLQEDVIQSRSTRSQPKEDETIDSTKDSEVAEVGGSSASTNAASSSSTMSVKSDRDDLSLEVTAEGSWDVSLVGAYGTRSAFLILYPNGGSHLEFSADGWFTQDLTYTRSGRCIRGESDSLGTWSVTLDSDGGAGMGWLGDDEFHMSRRSCLYPDAKSFAVGEWDLWSQKDRKWGGYFKLDEEGEGNLHYDNGFDAEGWKYDMCGHIVTGHIRGHGDFALTFAVDGTVANATIGRCHFNVWRRQA